MSESRKNVCWVTKKWVIKYPSESRGKHLGCYIHGILPVPFWHLNSAPNLLQLLGTVDILSKCFFLVIVIIIGECKLWTIKWFPSTAAMPLFQPSYISSRHYVSPDPCHHPVGSVVSNAIMCHLDIMRCKRVSGLMPWFQCIVSLLQSSKCLLPNEMVDLDDVEGGREGRLGCTLDRFRSEALADRCLREEGDCLSNEGCCSSMVLYELTMVVWGSCLCTRIKMLRTK